jgi:maleylpyruvate isomerase
MGLILPWRRPGSTGGRHPGRVGGGMRGRIGTVPVDLDADPGEAIELCRAAHARLMATVADVTDEQVRSPSRLPGWTIGHVLTHLARNADGHSRRLDGALRGADVPRYPGGSAQRDSEIDAGAPRPAADIITDLVTSQHPDVLQD